MSRASKFTDEQKMEIALDLISGKLSHAEICRKWQVPVNISALAFLKRPVLSGGGGVSLFKNRVHIGCRFCNFLPLYTGMCGL